jgi:hypothetical protein
VLGPASLKKRVKEELEKAIKSYQWVFLENAHHSFLRGALR